ncbi:MAG: hypothetical protein WCV72_04310 [Patescibacteria group bacterium]
MHFSKNFLKSLFQAERLCPVDSVAVIQTTKSGRDIYARGIGEVVFGGKNISDELLKLKVVKVFVESR